MHQLCIACTTLRPLVWETTKPTAGTGRYVSLWRCPDCGEPYIKRYSAYASACLATAQALLDAEAARRNAREIPPTVGLD